MTHLIIVTVTAINVAGEAGTASDYVCERQTTLDEAIANAKAQAVEALEYNFCGPTARMIVHIDTIPRPREIVTTVTATLPEEPEGEAVTVTATIS
jgi:hypothetical protein